MKLDDLSVNIKPKTIHLSLLKVIKLYIKQNIWNRVLLRHYTNHGLDHSERMIEILNTLLSNGVKLNEHEKFILLSSIYLHDIGMQSPIYAGLQKKANIL